MPTKTERITILGTPEFKAFLVTQAKKQGISLSEFVRRRCMRESEDDEQEILSQLLKELKAATKKAKSSLEKGIADAKKILSEMRVKHECD
ncbi:MAG: hypothetical protein JRF57_09180 [Deltaproteobacteria bacterium]|nr:hypothetical protein [Deltaproteobacteria bacterium]